MNNVYYKSQVKANSIIFYIAITHEQLLTWSRDCGFM
jgi:hypothetical protein